LLYARYLFYFLRERGGAEPVQHAWARTIGGGEMLGKQNDPAGFVEKVIKAFVQDSPRNDLGLPKGEKAFDAPLVGFSRGDDPLYLEYRHHIGAFYLTPIDLFASAFPGTDLSAHELAVISWILPSTARTRAEQARQRKYPSERWVRTRAQGEEFNMALRQHVVAQLASMGIQALAPLLSPLWSRSDQGPYAPCSNWSERHAAYAAGLGTFGLCDGLITPVGKAVRVGSVVARLDIEASARPYTDHHAYCLHYTRNTCRECVARCPVGALSEKGHDKKRCMAYTEKAMNSYVKKRYGIDTYACGLCQAGVACTEGIPDAEH